HTPTGVSSFKMLTEREMRVPLDTSAPKEEVAPDNASEYVLRLKEGTRKSNIARKHWQVSQSRQRKYYDRHSRTNVCHRDYPVQMDSAILLPRTHRKFYHFWKKGPCRVVKVLLSADYLVLNAHVASRDFP
ncbi:hypothetical protein TSMEX_008891, partial [Taenia solium]